MIKILSLYNYYTKKPTLKDINLELENSSIFGIIGPNGSGKTTFINCIIGINDYKGKIIWENEDDKRNIFYIPDENILPELLTGYEYIEFVSKLYEKNDLSNIDSYLETFGIKRDSHKLLSQYSYGMKKKIQLIAAFIINPKLLILDEIFRGLDIEAIIETKKLLKKYSESGGTVLLSSHDVLVVTQICNSIAMIYDGEIKTTGNPTKLIDQYNVDNLEELFVLLHKKG